MHVVGENGEASDGVGPTLSGVLTTHHGATESGACELPEGSYVVNNPVALGDLPSLQNLRYRPGMCGKILTVNCGRGNVDIIVSNSNLGGGLDLYRSSWNKATGGKPPGQEWCSVQLTDRNPFNFNGPRCYYAPTSEKHNAYSHILGLFNTNGRILKSATLNGQSGPFNGIQPYFAFHFGPVSEDAPVVFSFEDGSSHTVLLKDCIREGNKHIWSDTAAV